MFTGIIESVGQLAGIEEIEGDIRLTIESNNMEFGDVNLGDSIASNGVCLTVVDMQNQSYSVDVSRETLDKTAMQKWQLGDTLNLEKAMLPTTRFGGHMVSGHVDGVGVIKNIETDARSLHITVELPNELKRYAATKGSITVDGISLTTNLVEDNLFHLNIIPHTAEVTNIAKHWFEGALVNIEVDLIARYLERLAIADSK